MPALATSPGRFSGDGPRERITIFGMSAVRHGPRTYPCCPIQQYVHSSAHECKGPCDQVHGDASGDWTNTEKYNGKFMVPAMTFRSAGSLLSTVL